MKKALIAISLVFVFLIFLINYASAGLCPYKPEGWTSWVCPGAEAVKRGPCADARAPDIDPDSWCSQTGNRDDRWLSSYSCCWQYCGCRCFNKAWDEYINYKGTCRNSEKKEWFYDKCYDDYNVNEAYIKGCKGCKDYSNYMVMSCGMRDCDSLDTTCRDYHDVKRKCKDGACYDAACDSYTNRNEGKPCGTNGVCLSGTCTACQCSSGPCCDGCLYRSSGYKCADDITTEYGCPFGTALGSDTYVRHQDQYCSGSSASCTGTLTWDNWTISKDCNAGQFCKSGESECANATMSSAMWTNLHLLNQSITKAQINDTARLVAEGVMPDDTQINFKIKKKGLISDSLIITIQANFSEGKVSATWKISEEGKLYFEASLADYPSLMTKSDVLEVDKNAHNSKPVAKITFPNYDKRENYFFNTSYNIQFTQASYDVDDPINYLWNFGDGVTSNEANPIHNYTAGGPKKVTLTVTDARGLNATDKMLILINSPADDPPLVVISYPKDGFTYAIGMVRCNASLSIDDITPFENLIFRWKFNDICDNNCSGGKGCPGVKGIKGAICNKFFGEAGRKVVKVEVEGSTSTATTTFFIEEVEEEAKEEKEAEKGVKTAIEIPYLTITALLIAALLIFLIVKKLKAKKEAGKTKKGRRKK